MADNESQDTKCPCISTAKGTPARPRPTRWCARYPTYPPSLYSYLSSPCITRDDNSRSSTRQSSLPSLTYLPRNSYRETNGDTNCWKCLSLDQRGNKSIHELNNNFQPMYSSCINTSISRENEDGRTVNFRRRYIRILHTRRRRYVYASWKMTFISHLSE